MEVACCKRRLNLLLNWSEQCCTAKEGVNFWGRGKLLVKQYRKCCLQFLENAAVLSYLTLVGLGVTSCGLESCFCFVCQGYCLLALRCGGGGRGDGITANLFIRFHCRQERGNTARLCILSSCSLSSKLDALAWKNVQDSVPCKLHSWFLLNKTFPRHLPSKCYICQDTALVLISPTLKWVLALMCKIKIVFHLSWSVTRQFSFELFCSSAVQDLMWKQPLISLFALLLFIHHNIVKLA